LLSPPCTLYIFLPYSFQSVHSTFRFILCSISSPHAPDEHDKMGRLGQGESRSSPSRRIGGRSGRRPAAGWKRATVVGGMWSAPRRCPWPCYCPLGGQRLYRGEQDPCCPMSPYMAAAARPSRSMATVRKINTES
jgi:hypothetical protein